MKTAQIREGLMAGALTALLALSTALPANNKMDDEKPLLDSRTVSMLDLSQDQREQLKEEKKEHADNLRPLKETKKEHLSELRSLVNRRADDDDIAEALDQLKSDHEAVEEEMQRHMEKVGDILTPMQKAKWVLRMANSMGLGSRPTDQRK
jgi:Spy/CpxP family protein refolding chaperone